MRNLVRVLVFTFCFAILYAPAVVLAGGSTPVPAPFTAVAPDIAQVIPTDAPAIESTPVVSDPAPVVDAPNEPVVTLDPNALLIGVLVVVALLIVVLGVNTHTLSKALYSSVPTSVIAGAKVTSEELLAKGDKLVAATPTLIDDAAYDVIKRAVREVLTEPKTAG